MPSQHKSLTAGAAALVAAKSLSFALTLATPFVLLRIFDQTAFGIYKQAFVLVQTIITVLPPGFCMTSFYFFPREPEKARSVAFNSWLVASLIGLIPCLALFLRPDLIHYAVNEAEAVADARWIGLVILLWSSSLFIELAPLANRDVNFASKFIVIANVLKSMMMLTGALITRSLHGVLIASAVFGICQLAILMYYLHSRFPGFFGAFDLAMLKKQVVYFAKITPGTFMGDLQLWMPWYFVRNHYTTVQYAIYSVGCFNIPVTQILLESVGSLLVRKVSELVAIGDTREIIRVSLSATRKLSLAFFPFYVLMVVVSREFIQTVARDKYLDAVPIFVLNITLVPLSIFVFDPVGRAFPDQQGNVLRFRALGLVVMVVGLWFGTAHFGPLSATVAVLAAAIVERTSLLLFWGRFLGATKADLDGLRDMGRVAIAAIGAGLVTWLVRLSLLGLVKPFFVLAACSCVFAPVYVTLLFLLNVPNSDERRMISNRIVWFTRVAKLA